MKFQFANCFSRLNIEYIDKFCWKKATHFFSTKFISVSAYRVNLITTHLLTKLLVLNKRVLVNLTKSSEHLICWGWAMQMQNCLICVSRFHMHLNSFTACWWDNLLLHNRIYSQCFCLFMEIYISNWNNGTSHFSANLLWVYIYTSPLRTLSISKYSWFPYVYGCVKPFACYISYCRHMHCMHKVGKKLDKSMPEYQHI